MFSIFFYMNEYLYGTGYGTGTVCTLSVPSTTDYKRALRLK